MLEQLKKAVYEANMLLPQYGLITFTWGNVSGLDKESRLMVIKPSGVAYDQLSPDDMVVLDMSGRQIEGKLKPSSDTATHLALYNAFEDIGGIVHTHSTWATAIAQTGGDIQPFGTTHADYFCSAIPCTRDMTEAQVSGAYEAETGNVIVSTLKERNLNPLDMPAILVKNHGPFTWGKNAAKAVENSVVLEEVAKMAVLTKAFAPQAGVMPEYLLQKHFYRKHGANAYYGQN